MAKVSIIMPIYNAESHFERATASVLAQTYKDIELILVDDGSGDGSPILCDELAKKDNRVKVCHKENGGPSSARNKGLELATGDFIQFVDADDFLQQNTTEKLVEGIANSDFVICGYNLITEDSVQKCTFERKELVDLRKNHDTFFKIVKKGLFNSLWNKLYRRELLLGKFDEKYFIGEDTIFNINYIKNCKKTTILPDILYNYDFTNQNSIIHTKIRNHETYMLYWGELYSFCQNYFEDKNYIKELNGMYIKNTMMQIINTTAKEKLSYKEYRKLFNLYRNEFLTTKAVKRYSTAVFYNKHFIGKIIMLLFKFKLRFCFSIVMKVYTKSKTK